MLYEVFDHLGLQLLWWAWNTENPLNRPMFASVPMTSAYLRHPRPQSSSASSSRRSRESPFGRYLRHAAGRGQREAESVCAHLRCCPPADPWDPLAQCTSRLLHRDGRHRPRRHPMRFPPRTIRMVCCRSAGFTPTSFRNTLPPKRSRPATPRAWCPSRVLVAGGVVASSPPDRSSAAAAISTRLACAADPVAPGPVTG